MISKIDIQGHRGCRGLLPENALPAFKKAIELGVHTLEMDVVISKDDKVIVSHEPFMSRRICLKPSGSDIPESEDMKHNLYEMTHEEIKQFDCGLKFYPDYPEQKKVNCYKPLLDEVFKTCDAQNPSIKYNIEVKCKPKYDQFFTPNPKIFVSLILDVIKKYPVFERTNLQSFDLRILEEIKRQAPKMKVALLVDEGEEIAKKLTQLSYIPEIISPYFKLLDAETVFKFQNKGFQIIPWTVNQESDIKRMIDFKVDGIITDYPDKLIKMLKN